MPAIAVLVFALTWWGACHLVARDPARRAPRRAAGALAAYAIGVVIWTVWPQGTAAHLMLCLPALCWAGAAVDLLPDAVPERRQLDLAGRVASAVLLVLVVVVPQGARLVVLLPLAGALALLWRFRDQVRPPRLAPALAVTATLYAAALATLVLLPLGAGPSGMLIAAIGLDLLVLGYLTAVADAVDTGERLGRDLTRAVVAALVGMVLAGVPVTMTLVLEHRDRTVTILQFVLLAVVMTGIGAAGPLRRLFDTIAFGPGEPLREDRAALLMLADALPRHRRLTTAGAEDFERFVRHALDNYQNLGRLARSPLTSLPVVRSRLDGGAAELPPARARELRRVLAEEVARLRPSGPFALTDDWCHYHALHFCLVRGLDPYARRQLADGLGREEREVLDWMRRYVPRRVLRRWQLEGAARVATGLRQPPPGIDVPRSTRQPAAERP